jgi:large subunit ribosomal protein LP2
MKREAKMRLVAAYLLVVLGSNNNPNLEDIKSILGSVRVDVDDKKINFLLS